jgi:hypothetical protein
MEEKDCFVPHLVSGDDLVQLHAAAATIVDAAPHAAAERRTLYKKAKPKRSLLLILGRFLFSVFQAVLARTQPFLSRSVEKKGDQSRFKCRKMVNDYAIRSTVSGWPFAPNRTRRAPASGVPSNTISYLLRPLYTLYTLYHICRDSDRVVAPF